MQLDGLVRALFPANDPGPRREARFSGARRGGCWRIVVNGRAVGAFASSAEAERFAAALAAAMRREGFPARLARGGFHPQHTRRGDARAS
jgi:hypothetical protein